MDKKTDSKSDLALRSKEFYIFLWQFLADEDLGRNAWLDEELGGKYPSDYLLDIPAGYGVGQHTTVVDVGCGKGRQSVELVF